MKPRGFALLIAAFICSAIVLSTSAAAPAPSIISSTGTYSLTPVVILVVNQADSGDALAFSLNESGGGGLTRNIPDTKPGDPFVFYWDNQGVTLWWATPAHYGFCRIDHPHTYSSSTHRRSELLHDYDQFPQLPVPFKSAMEKSVPVRK
jgi:hypothetical protein